MKILRYLNEQLCREIKDVCHGSRCSGVFDVALQKLLAVGSLAVAKRVRWSRLEAAP